MFLYRVQYNDMTFYTQPQFLSRYASNEYTIYKSEVPDNSTLGTLEINDTEEIVDASAIDAEMALPENSQQGSISVY